MSCRCYLHTKQFYSSSAPVALLARDAQLNSGLQQASPALFFVLRFSACIRKSVHQIQKPSCFTPLTSIKIQRLLLFVHLSIHLLLIEFLKIQNCCFADKHLQQMCFHESLEFVFLLGACTAVLSKMGIFQSLKKIELDSDSI